ncbi:recombinase family protein [Kocuria sp. SL71]|nr:recombinase family protein [Kocuria sp. SL71]
MHAHAALRVCLLATSRPTRRADPPSSPVRSFGRHAVGRSTVDTLRTVQHLDTQGVTLRALDMDLDTSTPAGRLVVSVLASLAQWERETMIERTHAGLEHARRQGRTGGRPTTLTPTQVQAAQAALDSGMTVTDVATLHGVSKRTIHRVKAGHYAPLSRPSAEG